MTVSIAKVRGGKKSYYESELEATPDSYYLKEQISENKFVGKGALQWGLNEQVITRDTHAFHALFRGEHPQTGEPLIQGTHTERVYQQEQETKIHKAVRAYDLTFSPPKSVSIVESLSWANGDIETARTVWECHERSVRATLEYVEKRLLFTRTGAGGRYRERVEGVFALIHHNTSRPISSDRHPDPQLHTHALVFNAGVRRDGTTGALDAWPLFRSHHRLGELYRQRLQQELQAELGFSVRQVKLEKGWSFEIEGVPQSLISEFSQRRRAIKQRLKGGESPKQVRKEVLATRKAKVEGLDRKALLASWKETARVHGFDVQAVVQGRTQRVSVRDDAKPVQGREHTLVQKVRDRNYTAKPHAASPQVNARLTKASFPVTRRLIRTAQLKSTREHSATQKTKRLKRKFLWLYATGRISRKTYLRVTQGRGLPTSRLGIDVAYATYRISQAQRLYLYHKYGYGLPKGAPTNTVSINLAYATYQITAGQRLYLLHRQKRSHELQATKQAPALKRLLTRMTMQKPPHPTFQQSHTRPSILRQIQKMAHGRKQMHQPQPKPRPTHRLRP